jgi:hypothetical protein
MGGRLVDTVRNVEVSTPEELDFFQRCGVQWLEPRDRVAG